MKTKGIPMLAAIICIIATMLMVCGPAAAESVADFYKGKTVKILVGFAAGNATDAMGRVLANYLSKQIGADVVVVNKGGGGGLVCRNEVYNITEPDGLTFMWDPSLAVWPGWLLDQKGVAYDITKFGYLGGIVGEMQALCVRSDGPYQSIEDLQKSKEKIRLAVSGIAQLPCLSAIMAVDSLGLNAKITAGYKNSRACATALVQGEATAVPLGTDSAFRFIEGGMNVKPLTYIWYKKSLIFKDLPSMNEFTKIPDGAMTLMKSLPVNSKIAYTPPNTPKDRVQFLQESLEAVMAGKDFQEETKRVIGLWLGVNSGKELQEMADVISQNKSGSLDYYKASIEKYVN